MLFPRFISTFVLDGSRFLVHYEVRIPVGGSVEDPDPGSEFFHPESRVEKIPDQDLH
jgi:hypothetical protein